MITKNDIKFIQSLKQTKSRKENKMFLVEGNKLVDELLSSNFKAENILVTDLWLEKFPEMAGRLPFYDIISQKQMADWKHFQKLTSHLVYPQNHVDRYCK